MLRPAVRRSSAARLHQTFRLPSRVLRARNNSTAAGLSAIFSDELPKYVSYHTVFSGIQPTGVPHLGNYLGALQQWVKLQDEAPKKAQILYSIVDLHAITVHQDPKVLIQWKKEMLAALLAIGLNPERSIIFYQSSVRAHSELMWILNCNASMGNLSRMTQWKSKAQIPDESSLSPMKEKELKLGLFSYPVLQAADILLYQTTHVPVGEDQSQHLEFTRTCANAFNDMYPPGPSRGKTRPSARPVFTIPKTILAPAKRVMSLTNPSKKMSKSDPSPNSRILITDPEAEIRKKFRTAVTDSTNSVSYDPDARPGVSNLLDILFHLEAESQGAATPADIVSDFDNLTLKALKEKVSQVTNAHLEPIRERYNEIMSQDGNGYLEFVARKGAEKASAIADKTLNRVHLAMGLRDPNEVLVELDDASMAEEKAPVHYLYTSQKREIREQVKRQDRLEKNGSGVAK